MSRHTTRATTLQGILWDLTVEKGRAVFVLPGSSTSPGLTVVHYEQEQAFLVGREGVPPGAEEVKAVQEAMYWLWGEDAAVIVGDVKEVNGWMAVRLEWIGQGVLFGE